MKKTIIIYGSQYGTTRRYAEHLSEMTRIETVAFKEAKDMKISKMPEEKLNAEAKTILATYGKKEDFVDYDSLTAVMTAIV